MILNSPYITGSITVTGNANIQGQLTVTGSLSGTAATASFALTLDGTGSVGFATTGAFTATSGSASSRLTQIEQVYATTGSNSFRATQSITGSLTVTGQIIAQTINVQQVTSSIVYSSGSNTFGCDLNSRQTFTGSFYQTGSVASFSNNVGIGTTNPLTKLNIKSDAADDGILLEKPDGTDIARLFYDGTSTNARLDMFCGGSAKVQIHTNGNSHFSGGNVGIGTSTTDYAKLNVYNNTNDATYNSKIQAVFGNSDYRASDAIQIFGAGTSETQFLNGSTSRPAMISLGGNLATSEAVGVINFFRSDNASTYRSRAQIWAATNASGCSTTLGGYIVLSTADTGCTNPQERLRIASGGNVGINSTSPCARLHVQGNAALEDLLYFCAGGSVNTKFVYTIASGADDAFILRRNHTTQGNLCIMSWTYNGFVGVGTVTPTALLQVRGPNAAGVFFDAQNDGAGGATFNRINASSFPYNQYTFLNGYLGIGTNSPSYTLHVEAPSNSIAGYFKAGGTSGYAALAFTGNGGSNIGVLTTTSGCLVLGRSNGSVPNQFGANLDFLINCANGNILINSSLGVVGSVSKGSGSFKIKHPLASKKCTHQLVHSFIEGPQADLIYSGHTALQNGISCINMDCAARMTEGTFLALNRCLRVFTTNETSWDQVKGRVIGNVLIVESQNTESNDEISWMVIGERQDEHMLETEWTDEQGRVITEPEIVQ